MSGRNRGKLSEHVTKTQPKTIVQIDLPYLIINLLPLRGIPDSGSKNTSHFKYYCP